MVYANLIIIRKMLPRSYLFVKCVCLNAASDTIYLNNLRKCKTITNLPSFFANIIFLGVIHRNLCGIERKPILENNINNFSRNISWSHILAVNTDKNIKKDATDQQEGNKENKKLSDLKKDTPILKVIAPALNDEREKFNVENVKEQIVEKPKAKLTEPIKALKEKILDLKSDKTEQGMYNLFH